MEVAAPKEGGSALGPPGPKDLGFAAVFRDHHDFVWRILRRMGVPEALLEDATQEVFVVLHRRSDAYDPEVSIRSFLFGIARRVASLVRRGEYRTRRRLRALPAPAQPPDPDEQLARIEAAEFVEEFLERLEPQRRMVFVLADIEGMTGPEIADALGIPMNTVYSRLRLARRAFERALARYRRRRLRGG
jgi:RNA polymerase sigma-70 factor (ECF subfamily)